MENKPKALKNTPKPPKITASTQAYLDIDEIKEDVVVLKDTSLRAVVYVSSLNFDLKSEGERQAILGSFQGFLNSLNFPIQIMATSKKMDLRDYLEQLKAKEAAQNSQLIKLQIREYTQYISGLLNEINIMEKMFFVVVPFYPIALDKKNVVSKFLGTPNKGSSNFENDKIQLMDRVDVVVSGLKDVGLNCASLDTNGLIQLFYSIYNPETSQTEKIEDVSGVETQIVQYGGLKEHKDAEHLEI